MAKQQLLVVAVVVASVVLNAVDVSSASAYDALVKNNLPPGLFPKGVQAFDLKADGSFEATLPKDCDFVVSIGGQQTKIEFSRKFGGAIHPGSIRDMYGMGVNVRYAWIPISQIDRAGNQLTLTAQKSRLPVSVGSFAQSPSCS